MEETQINKEKKLSVIDNQGNAYWNHVTVFFFFCQQIGKNVNV